MIESRVVRATEVRASKGPSGPRLEGYASIFDSPAQLPGFRETIRSTAFDRALRDKHDVVALWNHNADLPLGRTTSGTLRLDKDSRGLHYVVDLPNTQAGRDAHESVRRGDVNGCSFGFMVDNEAGQSWSQERDADGTYFVQRDISDLKLLDVSPVTYPSYAGTQVAARSVEVPAELRSAIAARNKGFVLPTIEECIQITLRAEERYRREAEERQRRNDLMNKILSL